MSGAKSIVSMNNAAFGYDPAHPENLAVKGVSLHVERGEFLSIIGHNGSGKSTLAKMLNGLLLPVSGTVEVNGYQTTDESHIWNIREKVGMVFQNPDNQFVAPTVEDDIAFGLENRGVPQDEMEGRILDALEKVDMTDFRFHEPNKLSGGQKQRVAIAGMLAIEPDILVLDEATAMLDPRGRAEVLEVVRKMNQILGMTVIQITHYLEETLNSDRIVVMDQGQIVGEGTPEVLYQQVDWLRKLGLDVPFACDLKFRLGAIGIRLPGYETTSEGVLQAIWTSSLIK
ncbi:energy-coupling factor transporter ATPase [Aneurinibacillus sp. Ricciae_BoGa-3]|uniref:energy-coupling factor transporter ATPase n=1 Tax=Aneurinibacillus sp. Ricciae_BoGa-3 TaxID=3022697 RepID=UPI0023413C9E|nr:energy-coupling factor transporter ATPase [Aneurinibacillus sp. Ricciae_BoGa-3]WCK54789.1 energy-coupling factor transporter ATPase [Aneurinibacillus sp. Ricciae_BoGa-3]